MAEQTHTKGRVEISDLNGGGGANISLVTGGIIAHTAERAKYAVGGELTAEEAQANARRIVALWNTCEGISTEALEGGVVQELVEALEAAATSLNTVATLAGKDEHLSEIAEVRSYARSRASVAFAAAAKATGQE